VCNSEIETELSSDYIPAIVGINNALMREVGWLEQLALNGDNLQEVHAWVV
jgi:hypothetical protein